MTDAQVARELVAAAKLLVGSERTSSSNAIMDLLVDQRELYKLKNNVDEATWKLTREVYSKLADAVKLSSNEEGALNRLRASMSNNYSEDMHRNNLFKAADMLGIKLPHSMF